MRALSLLILVVPLSAQAGDRAGEVQPDPPADLVIPAAPLLSAEEALGAFDVEGGWTLELFAAEPLVEDPVALAFDAIGRAWVCEMRGYMPDADGNGEDKPVGQIAVLEDTDGDGRADRRTVFLDGLVMPRAVHPCEDGALVIAPPELALWRDTDGDGRADTKEVLRDIGRTGLNNPEHAVNGLEFGDDGRWHLANASFQFARVDGEWQFWNDSGGGQWGVAFDERGRKLFNTNSDPVRGDLYPSRYAVRNPNHGRAHGANMRWASDFAVYPARVNTGVNRGYQPATLRDDFTLANFTSACGAHAHGGDVFVCEPAGNLVKRYKLLEEGLRVNAASTNDAGEFLRSTDERFRPVQMRNGPDGALYVVDFYRGIIQHRVFLTSYLRRQAESRALVGPAGLGRIWRVKRVGDKHATPSGLGDASWTELVERLGHIEPWWRRTALRVLLEEAGEDEIALDVLGGGLESKSALVRRGALTVLDQIGRARPEHVIRALGDADEAVRIAALVASECFLASSADDVFAACTARVADASSHERLQLILSAGEARTERGDELLFAALDTAPSDDRVLREAVISGLRGRELEFLARCGGERHRELRKQLARAVVREGRTERIHELLARSRGDDAACAGILAGRPPGRDGEPSWIRLALRPPLDVDEPTPEVWAALAWPGRADLPAEAEVRGLDEHELKRFDQGRALFTATCAQCHQSSGLGEPGKAPALRHSPYVLGDAARLTRIVSAGLVGPIEVAGQKFDAEMPAWGATDDELAAVLTYLRREWGHTADPVTPSNVATVRALDLDRAGPWTVESLRAARQ